MNPAFHRGVRRVATVLAAVMVLPCTVTAVTAGAQVTAALPGGMGYDISWPQCGRALPNDETQVAIVGVNYGRPFTANPCLGAEIAWARHAVLPYDLYLNLNWPNPVDMRHATNGPRGVCASDDVSCLGYNYGYNLVGDAASTIAAAGGSSETWWLDVETGDHWSGNTTGNAAVVQGAVDAVRGSGRTAGIYSINFMWQQITNGYQAPSVPVWVPGPKSIDYAGYYCNPQYSFDGGPVWLVQYSRGGLDGDLLCTADGRPRVGGAWHGPGFLGSGPLGGPPVMVAPSSGVLDVFWKGTDAGLWHTWHTGAGWAGPERLGGQLSSNPTVVSPSPGIVDVFWKGTEGHLWHKWFNGFGWQGPGDLGGALDTSPQAIAPGNGVVDVFWRGPDHALAHSWYNQGWSGPENLAPGSATDGQPVPATSVNGLVDVFWRGADRDLWHMFYSAGWHAPESLGSGPLGSDPRPVGWGNGHIEVVWRGTDAGLWENIYGPADGWQGVRSLGASGVTGEPKAVSWGLGDTDVYWLGTDGALWHHWFGRSVSVGDGPLGSAPSAATTSEGAVTVVWKGTDGNLWTDWYG